MLLDSKTLMDRPCASCRETADGTQRRTGYGVESRTRLNPTMSTNVPLFGPYDKFDYNAFYAGDDDDNDNTVADEDEVLVMDEDESTEKFYEYQDYGQHDT